jgi:hypothetical protein
MGFVTFIVFFAVKLRSMNLTQIIQSLKRERGQLNKAITALESVASKPTETPHRTISAAGRARIAKAQRERWAKLRAAKKKAA